MVPFLHTLYPTFPPIAPSHPISFLQSFFTLNSSPPSLSHLVPLSLSTFFLQSTTANFPRSPLLHYSPYRTHSRKQFPLTRKNYLQYVPILLPKEPARLSFPSTGLYQTLPSEQLPPLLYYLPTFLPSPIFLSPYPSLSKFQSQGHSTRYINLFPHPKLMYVSLPLSFSLNPSLPLLDFLSLPHAFFFLLILPRLPISSITSKGHVCKVD